MDKEKKSRGPKKLTEEEQLKRRQEDKIGRAHV